jgi:hypothetical protein
MFRPAVDVPSCSVKGREFLDQFHKEVFDPWDQQSPDLNRQCSGLVCNTYRAVIRSSLALCLSLPPFARTPSLPNTCLETKSNNVGYTANVATLLGGGCSKV